MNVDVKTVLFILLFISTVADAQNLVPNGNFEEYINCPNDQGQIYCSKNWYNYALLSSPDYFNVCAGKMGVGVPNTAFGYQFPAHGDAFAGIFVYLNSSTPFSEYFANDIPPLVAGSVYEVSMSVSLANKSGIAVNNLGVYFYHLASPSRYVNSLPVIPQISYSNYKPVTDTANWTRLTQTFTADSAYNHLIIGGYPLVSGIDTVKMHGVFVAESYYFIDSVVVRLIRVKTNFIDSVVCQGDSVISVPYTVMPGANFNPGNIFTLQLSDAFGSFNNPINIGSVTAVGSGTIQGIIPPNLPFGTGYKVRIVSTSPVDYSPDNGVNIILNFSVTAGSNSPICEKDTLKLTATKPLSGIQYNWSGSSFTSSQQNPVIDNASVNAGGKYFLTANYGPCIAHDTVGVTVNPLPIIVATSNSPACINDTIKLHTEATILNALFNWIGPGFHSTEQNPIIAPVNEADSGTYSVTATVNGCTSQRLDINVDVLSKPAFDLGEDQYICSNQKIIIGAEYPGSTYTWNTGSKECCISITDDGIYTESITNVCGTASDSISVHIISCNNCVFVPNTFTPNGDGTNDRFFPMAEGVKNIDRFLVYDRWGEQLHEAHNFPPNDPQYGWDGTYKGEQLNPGVYIYYLEARCLNGEKLFLKGDISLVK